MSETSLFRLEHLKTDDSGDIQRVDVLGHANEQMDGAIRPQWHGFASNPPKGSNGVGLRARGISELPIILGLEHHKHRQRNLAEGNSVVYDAKGNVSRYLGDDGIWHDAGSRPHKLTGKKIVILADGDDAAFGSKTKKTYLGGDGKDGTYAAVMTESGPSTVVFAKL